MKEHQTLRVSRFDAVTSALMTVMLFASAVTGVLMLLWLVSLFESPQEERLVRPVGIATVGLRKAENQTHPFDQPGRDEFPGLVEPAFNDFVAAVTDAASRMSGSSAGHIESLNATESSSGPSRTPGPDLDDEGIVPRSDRWQLNFTAKNQLGYAQQLEFFKIELGAVGGEIIGLDIVNQLTDSPQSRRLEDASTEKRLYFMFKRPSPLMQYERAIHRQARVDVQGRNMFKLIPAELEDVLAKMELEYSQANGHSTIAEVAKTVFQSKSAGAGFGFQVINQRYRSER